MSLVHKMWNSIYACKNLLCLFRKFASEGHGLTEIAQGNKARLKKTAKASNSVKKSQSCCQLLSARKMLIKLNWKKNLRTDLCLPVLLTTNKWTEWTEYGVKERGGEWGDGEMVHHGVEIRRTPKQQNARETATQHDTYVRWHLQWAWRWQSVLCWERPGNACRVHASTPTEWCQQYDTIRYFNVHSKADTDSLIYHTESKN